ncbi:OLC1v1019848C1 [Oldenlandia corymbosa var. corymbosa]|uniref:OLC1v1019848C1 n=1 Tax=Oldenlandia corymbosa var. corymbosa TaxID=529605 RepID=A0AAV1EEW6_OLDCO|nr:OLC1v1019848C1 [Oldenlandia corymbosa var. corymbosa]
MHGPDQPANEKMLDENEDESMDEINPLVETLDESSNNAFMNLNLGDNHDLATEESELPSRKRRSSVASRRSRKRKKGRMRPKKEEEKKFVEEDHHDNNEPSKEEERMLLVEDLNIPTHIVIDSKEVQREDPPIWFQLVASNVK